MICKIPLTLIAIQGDGYHLSIHAAVNDCPVLLLVDTGASRTVFDEAKMREILDLQDDDIEQNPGPSAGIGSNNLESSVTTISRLDLGGFILEKYLAALIDLSQVNLLFHSIGLDAVDGILGGDILKETKASVDYGKMTLTLRPSRKRSKPK